MSQEVRSIQSQENLGENHRTQRGQELRSGIRATGDGDFVINSEGGKGHEPKKTCKRPTSLLKMFNIINY